jgi:hypothetical protein
LREEAAIRGRHWLGGALADIREEELREMCKAAGLPVRANSSKKWLAMPELREVLLADLFPEAEKAGKWFDGKL